MTKQRLLGLSILIVGALAVYFGYQDAASDFGDRVLDGYVDTSKWYIFGGIGAVILGSLMTLVGKPA